MNTVTFKSAACVGTLQSHLAAAPVISMQNLLSQSNNKGLKNIVLDKSWSSVNI